MLSWMLWSYHQTQQWRNACCSLAPDIPVWPNSAKCSVKYYQLAWNSSGQAGADWSAVNGVKPLISRHNQHCKCCLMVIAAIMTVTFVLSVAVFICFSQSFYYWICPHFYEKLSSSWTLEWPVCVELKNPWIFPVCSSKCLLLCIDTGWRESSFRRQWQMKAEE